MEWSQVYIFRWLAIISTLLILCFMMLYGFGYYGNDLTYSRFMTGLEYVAVIGFIGAVMASLFMYFNWRHFKNSELGSLNVALIGFYILLFVMGVLIALAIGLWFFHGLGIKNLKYKFDDKEIWNERYQGYSLEHAENDLDVYFKSTGFLCGLIALIILLSIPSYIKLGDRLSVVHVFLQIVALCLVAFAVWTYLSIYELGIFRDIGGLDEFVSDTWLTYSSYMTIGILVLCLLIFIMAYGST